MEEAQKKLILGDVQVRQRYIFERTALKILVEPDGILIAFTSSRTAYFLFITRYLLGIRRAPTTDPDKGIVELCNYDLHKIVREWSRLYRVKVPKLAQS